MFLVRALRPEENQKLGLLMLKTFSVFSSSSPVSGNP